MANNNVRFIKVKLQETYDLLEVKDSQVLYWIDETQRLYCGDKLYGTGAEAGENYAGLMSVEDKAKLDSLVSCGITGLVPVDGTIKLIDDDNGVKKIGVVVAAEPNNALVAVDGGLFVPTVVVPEYAIERQETAEEGFAVSYKLKKTVGEDISYVGDIINIGKDMVLQGATLEIVNELNVPYDGAMVGDPYIHMVFNDNSVINIPVKDLVDTYTSGQGIEIVDNVISVKIADNAHGLVTVDGALTINLATAENDGAMSKEDKVFIDSIPHAYVSKKYEIAGAPKGTLVNYYEKEIRIMCPGDAEYNLQSVGAGGDANSYYVTLNTFAPNGAVGYIEHLGGQVDAEILKDIKIDSYGRRYQPTWLAVAKRNAETGEWSYYGDKSTESKYIGLDYQIDWYDADGVIIESDNVRINLSNKNCHFTSEPYYMAGYAESSEVADLKATIEAMEEIYTWGEM